MALPHSSFEQAHARIVALCDHFDAQREHVMGTGYKEAEARDQFITPFFEALGWDVRNTAHKSVYEKDVVIESRQNISGTAKSADYAFRRPGTHLTSFFVEAKKPSVDIRGHAERYQAVLYGWNASTPLVVLTDFEQFLILDARSEPDRTNAARHILKANGSYTWRDYRDPEKFAELWGLLARENVAAGSLDKAAAALPRLSGRIKKDDLVARGTGPVDETFLAQMEVWREKLAKSLKRTNHDLDGERLTSLTQRILDRLVFLRFLEDRGIERDVTFQMIGQGASAWRDFLKVSRRLDARYNGIIFKKDEHGCEDKSLIVDEATFAGIAGKFAPAHSSYLFDKISITILGSIYERFLGNVIVARDKTAIVEPKPEVRKAGGVYYTPDNIVRYIVEQTVGRCIAGKSPDEIEKLRFADIACGSGSFLVEVFASLIRYHLAWYLADGAAKWEKRGLLRTREIDGDYVLTLAEKRRILLANVFGVDLDPQAVAVTQLSLYLRLMEDESFPSTQLLFDEEHRALLPDLRDNILCGNSLIESDVADLFGMSPAEEEKIRPFDFQWQFPDVFKRGAAESSRVQETSDEYVLLGADPTHGAMAPSNPQAIEAKPEPVEQPGFDAIVGNPPYVLVQTLESAFIFRYLAEHYACAKYKIDTYHVFMERAVRLVREGGYFAYITPNSFLLNKHARELRRFLTAHLEIASLRLFNYQVFAGASVDTAILSGRKRRAYGTHEVEVSTIPGRGEEPKVRRLLQAYWTSDNLARFRVGGGTETEALERKIAEKSFALGDIATAYFGIQTHDREQYVRSAPKRGFVPIIDGTNIERYALRSSTEFVDFRAVAIKSGGKKHVYEQERVGVRQIGASPISTVLPAGLYTLNTIYNIYFPEPTPYSIHFVQAIVASKFNRWHWLANNFDQKKTFPKIKKDALLNIPIPSIDFSEPAAALRHEQVTNLVGRLISAKNSEAAAHDSVKRAHWTRQCLALDRQIDAMIYELYGLTQQEVALIEREVA